MLLWEAIASYFQTVKPQEGLPSPLSFNSHMYEVRIVIESTENNAIKEDNNSIKFSTPHLPYAKQKFLLFVFSITEINTLDRLENHFSPSVFQLKNN